MKLIFVKSTFKSNMKNNKIGHDSSFWHFGFCFAIPIWILPIWIHIKREVMYKRSDHIMTGVTILFITIVKMRRKRIVETPYFETGQ